MSVLILTNAFYPCPQSASQRITSFAKSVVNKRFNVIIMTATRCFKMKQEFSLDKQVLIYDLKCPRFLISASSVLPNPILVFMYFFMSVFVVLRKGVRVILVSVPNGDVAVAGFFLSKIFGIPLQIDMRDLYPPEREQSLLYLHVPLRMHGVLTWLFQVFYNNSGAITCVDSNIRGKLENFGVIRNKIFVIPNGADTGVYSPCSVEERREIRLRHGLPLDKFIFVYAGSLTGYYPVVNAIRAMNFLLHKSSDFLFLIISYLKYASYEELAKDLGLDEFVRFTGPLLVDETAEILAACDVGVVTYGGEDYWRHTYGAKIFSYMSCGLPVLASGPVGSVIDHLLCEHEIGFFVGEPSEDNFAEGFLYMLDRKGEVRNMGERARRVVEKFYDREKLGERLALLVEKLHAGGTELKAVLLRSKG